VFYAGVRSVLVVLLGALSVACCVVLFGATATSRLEVYESAEQEFRLAYDILVRNPLAVSDTEIATNSVPPNFLSGVYGGITLDEWETISEIAGVEIAAPISNLGVVHHYFPVEVDLSEWVNPSGRQLLRVTTQAVSRGGFSVPSQAAYLYVTDGELVRGENDYAGKAQWYEEIDGVAARPCLTMRNNLDEIDNNFLHPTHRYNTFCVSRKDLVESSYKVVLYVLVPLTLVAVDPAAEAAMYGLDAAIVTGRYLNADDTLLLRPITDIWLDSARKPIPVVPVLLADAAPIVDYSLEVQIDELPESAALALRDAGLHINQVAAVDASPVEQHLDDFVLNLGDIQSQLTNQIMYGEPEVPGDPPTIWARGLLQPGAVNLDAGAAIASDPWLWTYYQGAYNDGLLAPAPGSVFDSAYREVTWVKPDLWQSGFFSFPIVGTFSPEKLVTADSPALDTYRAEVVETADDATAEWLGDTVLRNNLNPADYLQASPTLIIPLRAVEMLSPEFTMDDADDLASRFATAPISAVRVRVAGVTGLDDVSQEKIRLVAEIIGERTGLSVDIVAGSALSKVPVTLTQTDNRPDLQVLERWSVKGAILAIVAATDMKSVAMAALVLIVCVITASIVAANSAQSQRNDLGILHATGHHRRNIIGYLLCQQAALGLASGILGWTLALIVCVAQGLRISLALTALAIPITVLLMVSAGLGTAIELSRQNVATLLRPKTRIWKHTSHITSSLNLGIHLLRTRPWRLGKSVITVATAVAACGFVTTIATAFRGAVVGTIFGDAVALRVRTSDIVAAVVLLTLGVVAVSLTLYYLTVEDQTDWATLRAIGWTNKQIMQAISVQGTIIGLAGSVIGATLAYATTLILNLNTPSNILITTLTAAATTILITLAATAIAKTTTQRSISQTLKKH
jgi:ABC-type lipoprotein release transport system permease subunit